MDNNTLEKNNTHMLRDRIRRTPLWIQLFTMMSLITISLVVFLTIFYYRSSRNRLTETRLNSLQMLIHSEVTNLDSYINNLSAYSVQGCYDNTFLRIVEKNSQLAPSEENYLSDQIKIYYYSRPDITSYNLYLFNSQVGYRKNKDRIQNIRDSISELVDSKYYDQCMTSSTFDTIVANPASDILFDYYHALLHIKTRTPMAMTVLEVDNSIWKELAADHSDSSEIVCLATSSNQLLACTDDSFFQDMSDGDIASFFENASQQQNIDFQRGHFYVNKATTSKHGLTLYAFTPVNALSSELAKSAHLTWFIGILLFLITLYLTMRVVQTMMLPLSRLSKDMSHIAHGDFDFRSKASGSAEIIQLSASFNQMLDQLQDLIHKNYVYKINEQNSKIIALEAQINPHYLYNTLQAISTEALMNDQKQIYKMINSLASGLRYSIKGDDMVPLERELKYTEDYIYLQKLRMNDKLTTTLNIADDTLQVMIPKISIQLLVENAIIHGIGEVKDSVSIKIDTYIKDNFLNIRVWDNGQGFDAETLANYKSQLSNLTPSTESIGLMNLASRLEILFSGRAFLFIDSVVNEFSEVTITIPVARV